MRKMVLVLILLICVAGLVFTVLRIKRLEKVPEVGREVVKPTFKAAPDFMLSDMNGDMREIADFKGKVVIINFWATWCPPCREEIPHLIELYEEYRDKGLEIIGISLDWNAKRVAGPFIEENGINYTVLLGDDNISDLYDVVSIPTSYILDREGGIVKKYIGYRDKEVFEKKIEELL